VVLIGGGEILDGEFRAPSAAGLCFSLPIRALVELVVREGSDGFVRQIGGEERGSRTITDEISRRISHGGPGGGSFCKAGGSPVNK
jgi:hypothetical protein